MRENARGNSENRASPLPPPTDRPTDRPPARSPARSLAIQPWRRRRPGRIDCERARNAPMPLLHAPHAFSQLPVSAGLRIPARKRNFLPIQCAGRNNSILCASVRADSRAHSTLRRVCARYFYLRVNWRLLGRVGSGLSRTFDVSVRVLSDVATYRLLALHGTHCANGYIVNAGIIDNSTR